MMEAAKCLQCPVQAHLDVVSAASLAYAMCVNSFGKQLDSQKISNLLSINEIPATAIRPLRCVSYFSADGFFLIVPSFSISLSSAFAKYPSTTLIGFDSERL